VFRIESAVSISRPVEAVFAFVADANNDKRWRSMVVETRWLSGTPGQVGARYRQVLSQPGSTYEADSEVTAAEPNRRLAFQTFARDQVKLNGTWSFAPEGVHTRLRLTLEVELLGMKRLAQPVIRVAMQRGFDEALGKLKAHLEATR
jgi:uncharacterized protein YndB with AHSA1/START domain